MSRHLSTLTLHRLRYGELDGPASDHARTHLASCAVCADRLGVQERERAAFVLQPMPEAIRAAASPPRRSWARELQGLALALVAAAAVFLLVPLLRGPIAADPLATGSRAKGVELPTVEAWVDQGSGARPLRPDDVLSAGERVQLKYDPQDASSVALAGRDVTGQIEVYTTNAPVGIGLVEAPFALTLDDAPGTQELFVVGSNHPLDDDAVKAAVVTGVPGVRVARVAIHKAEVR